MPDVVPHHKKLRKPRHHKPHPLVDAAVAQISSPPVTIPAEGPTVIAGEAAGDDSSAAADPALIAGAAEAVPESNPPAAPSPTLDGAPADGAD